MCARVQTFCRRGCLLTSVFFLLATTARGGGEALFVKNCDGAMDGTLRDLGSPDSVTKGSAWDTDYAIWVYRSLRLVRTFEWGPLSDCEVTDKYVEPASPGP